MYKIMKDRITGQNACIVFGELCIPFDERNADYKEYLAWLEQGNTPEESDGL